MSKAKEESALDGVVMLPLPEGLERMESGPIQFGDDWAGVFIRGDNAIHMAMLMNTAAEALRVSIGDQISATQLKGYAKLISSCVST